jgi:hypothetical protein
VRTDDSGRLSLSVAQGMAKMFEEIQEGKCDYLKEWSSDQILRANTCRR